MIPKALRNGAVMLILLLGTVVLLSSVLLTPVPAATKDYSAFLAEVRDGSVASVVQQEQILTVTKVGTPPDTYQVQVPTQLTDVYNDVRAAATAGGRNPDSVTFGAKKPDDSGQLFSLLISALLPVLLIGGLFVFMMRSAQGQNNQAMSFGKSKAKMFIANKTPVTFADVAGVEEAKVELEEVVEFLKFPERFEALGAKIPKGVLLIGSPGTGKTLLARAVAGEAGVPFFSISGSEFVEMFVGVGASRVRDLFDQAKRNSPCIVFIDEIDAVGRQRGAGLGGSHDEREQTLNQILVEMDGFETGTNVIIIAATNRPDVLDPALLRPGRFDRQVILDRPDLKGRIAILKVHVKGKPLDKILAARRSKRTIGMDEFAEALDRVMAGPQRKSRLITDAEKQIIAYHEGGHAVVGRILEKCDPVSKVTVISRGMALGYTMNLPTEDRYLQSKSEFEDKIAAMLGGNIAEQLVFGDTTTGASNDIEKATDLARKMVTRFGMSEKLGTVTLGRQDEMIFLGREMSEQKNYSEAVAKQIDEEVRAIIDRGAERAREVLTKHRDRLDALAAKLIAEETVEGEAFETLFADLPAKPAAYAGLLDRLRAAGVSIPVAKVDTKGEPAAKPGPGGAAAGQPA
jgi:cell division protease FtsH